MRAARARIALLSLLALGGLGAVGLALGLGRGPAGSALVVVHDPLPGARPPAPPEAPSVVVVIGCTVRRDQLGLYRPELDSTPWLRSIRPRGALFTDAVTAAPWTRPASVAILTGRHAAAVGMVEPGPGRNRRRLDPAVPTLPAWFRDHGWTTLGGSANPNLSSQWGLHRGFDAFVEPSVRWEEGAPAKHTGLRLVERVLPLVDGAEPDRPLFLLLLLLDAHMPYPAAPPAAAEDRSVPIQVHRYRAGLRQFDRAVQALHQALEERGYTDRNTLLVVLNDHGEGLDFPAHHGKAHGRYLAPSTVGGVWWMAGPGIPAGAEIAGLASQVDVFPTLADLAGIPWPGPGPGISHRDALARGRTARERAFSDTWFQRASRAAIYTPAIACQEDFGGREEGDERFRPGCFDRAADPDHRVPKEVPEVQAELERWRADLEARMARFGGLEAPPEPGINRQLEALGYLEEPAEGE